MGVRYLSNDKACTFSTRDHAQTREIITRGYAKANGKRVLTWENRKIPFAKWNVPPILSTWELLESMGCRLIK